ncbi:Crp/Fnr family transcriptional regulator [Pedobacter roseus]|jgi:CRP-like cAMP-binding protein|uniref:Crp/Fnr family transcriptional regulator n=1 Tax=Pedobacter roseus TaxID=336820 RepID=A0A7G9QL07_9SPHI|nr:Crp/Fnr family transcriptional regulator [Pedobacter roseus]QNN44032.1 Crp/Fnr family transcriptional regulator [Pedobacter roseus]
MPQFSAYHNILPLIKYFEQYHPLSKGFIADHVLHCRRLQVKKNKFILSPIDHNASLYFITSGLVRGFIKDNGKDITTRFSFENETIGAIHHPDQTSNHSVEYLQALEDSELISIPFALIDSVYSLYPEANVIGRKMLAIQYYAASERSILARITNAASRYQKFASTKSVAVDRIPLRHLASYLGMRSETLSRIRSKEIKPSTRK